MILLIDTYGVIYILDAFSDVRHSILIVDTLWFYVDDDILRTIMMMVHMFGYFMCTHYMHVVVYICL